MAMIPYTGRNIVALKDRGYNVQRGTTAMAATMRTRQLARYRPRFNYSMKQTLGPLTRQAMRTGGWANPSRGGELKFIDVIPTPVVTFASAAFGAAPTLLNGCIPGSTATSRIGRKIVLKSLYIRYTFALAATSTGGSPVRILVVYDKQANAVAPAITDVLLTDAFNSTNNLSNRDRFITIFDEVSNPISTGDIFSCSNTIYKKLNLETMFNAGTAGTVGDITTGSLHLFAAQNGSIGTANPPLTMHCRLRFDDT